MLDFGCRGIWLAGYLTDGVRQPTFVDARARAHVHGVMAAFGAHLTIKKEL